MRLYTYATNNEYDVTIGLLLQQFKQVLRHTGFGDVYLREEGLLGQEGCLGLRGFDPFETAKNVPEMLLAFVREGGAAHVEENLSKKNYIKIQNQ